MQTEMRDRDRMKAKIGMGGWAVSISRLCLAAMPIGTPFHSRTAALCASHNWRTWSGYFVASSYDVMHDYEYHAIRNTAALIDVSPLYKYDVRGKDALKLVNRVITRDAAKCAVGQALYGCLCEDDGAVIQDGTVFRLGEDYFRFHLADPGLRWLNLNALGMDVSIQEVSEQVAALALQGPNALKILERIVDVDLTQLKFFRLSSGKILDVPIIVSRTGYTGDLGYELWFGAEHALKIWDVLIEQGRDFGIKPTGILALDVARLEAGFILLEVDYIGAEKAVIRVAAIFAFRDRSRLDGGFAQGSFRRRQSAAAMRTARSGAANRWLGDKPARLRIPLPTSRPGAAIPFGGLARQRTAAQR